MRWLLDLAIAFLALGAVEAVVKPLARRFVQHCSGAELEQAVRQKLEALTGGLGRKDQRMAGHTMAGHADQAGVEAALKGAADAGRSATRSGPS